MPSITLKGSCALFLKAGDTGEGGCLGTINKVIVQIIGQQEHAGGSNPKILHWPIITVCSGEVASASREEQWLCAQMIPGPAHRELGILFNSYSAGSQANGGPRERPVDYDTWESPKRKPPCHLLFN